MPENNTNLDLLPVPALLEAAWKRFREVWLVGILILLAGFLAILLAIGLFALFDLVGAGLFGLAKQSGFKGSGPFILQVLFAILLLVGIVFVSSLTQATLHIAILERAKIVRIGEIFARGYAVWRSFFLVQLLFGLMIVGGAILFIVPAIYLAVRYAFQSWALIVDGKRGRDAFRTSSSLIKNRFWNVLGRLAILVAFSLIAQSLVSWSVEQVMKSNLWLAVALQLIGAALLALVNLYGLCASLLLYEDLKRTRLPETA